MSRHPPLEAAGLLALVALLGTALLAGTWALTHERIADQERRAQLRQLNQLVPPERYDNDLHSDRITVVDAAAFATPEPVTVWRARRGGAPVAAILRVTAPDGYNGAIVLLVAVDPVGEVLGVRVVSHRETPGLGDAIERGRSDWILGFDGRSLGDPPRSQWTVQRNGGAFASFTGATITPRAVVHAVRRTLAYFEANRAALFARPPQPPATAGDER